jgi:MFS family permease
MPRDGSVPSKRCLWALDLLNFFMADVQTGFGPFVAVYLTAHKWTQGDIGLALSLGSVTAMVSQLPAGAIIDMMRSKRAAAAAGIVAVVAAAVTLAAMPYRFPVLVAEVLHGLASYVITPAIAAISLRLVGHAALGERLGRNASFASIGTGLAAGVMGAIGTYVSSASVFWLTAALGLPALLALWRIAPAGPANDLPEELLVAAPARRRVDWRGLRVLFADRRLLVFAGCAVLFHLSNAAMLPLAASEVTKRAEDLANLIIAACIVVPQAVVACASPWIGRHANRWGRRPMLLIGWAALPTRALLLALLPGPWLLVAGQSISGISAAVFGVMLPLVAADLTSGRRHFNLCIGAFGLCSAAGATLSTAVGGWISDNAGQVPAFLALAAAGLVGTLAIWALMPETAPILATSRVLTRGLQARTSWRGPAGLGRDEELSEIRNWKWGNPISTRKSS